MCDSPRVTIFFFPSNSCFALLNGLPRVLKYKRGLLEIVIWLVFVKAHWYPTDGDGKGKS